MVKVYTHFDRTPRTPCPEGSRFLNTYQEQIVDGIKSLVKEGEQDVHELIQMDAETVKIENILQRALMGDFKALNAREGTYVDATTMPKSLMEAQNLVLRMKSEFEKMPTEVKELFNNSADKYVELMGTKEFQEKMAPYNEKVAAISYEKNHKEYLKKVQDGAQLNYDIAKAQADLEGKALKQEAAK